ncbi:hypothetical protein CEP53_006955 [Fusarium sp. AF-6]|nr:hypothetical protein CEP53_006955 [Fusarium sp. AF-6]
MANPTQDTPKCLDLTTLGYIALYCSIHHLQGNEFNRLNAYLTNPRRLSHLLRSELYVDLDIPPQPSTDDESLLRDREMCLSRCTTTKPASQIGTPHKTEGMRRTSAGKPGEGEGVNWKALATKYASMVIPRSRL